MPLVFCAPSRQPYLSLRRPAGTYGSGNVQAHRLCVDATRRKGKVAFIGDCNDQFRSWHYNLNEYPKIMQVIHASSLIDQVISHVLPMREIQAVFGLSASHETAKIILQPWA